MFRPWPDVDLVKRSKPPYLVDSDEGDVMVIGIDFGTTYSGVAWATNADFESGNINVITSWPGEGREEGKVPTELFYEDGKVMWGYEIPPDAAPVQWFKLLLLKDEDLGDELRSSEFLLRGRKMLRENNKSVIDLIADYLRLLWGHVMDTINRARTESAIDGLPFHVVITVPAIWKGYARQGMEEAARKSGILSRRPAGPTTLTFAPEPEAAALSTLSEPGRKPKIGDVYVICDAGGGTVDLISYEISKVSPIAMHEAVEGTGGLCGGIFIDESFEDMCRKRLGRKWDRLSKAGIKQIMKSEWEAGAKPTFKPSNTKDYVVAIPAEAFGKDSVDDVSRDPPIKNGRIHFKSYHIQKVFIKCFGDIEKLVNEQIGRSKKQGSPPTGIILVGGLGSSPYLYETLKGTYSKAGIDILQSTGMRPRTAICTGAVYKGFLDGFGGRTDIEPSVASPISVTSTVSRFSFGTGYREIFDEDFHLLIDKQWDEDECQWKAANQMDWYIKRGENVTKKDPVRKSYYRNYRSDFGGSFSVSLYQCDETAPPSRRTSDVNFLCTIDCILDVPFSSLEDFVNSEGVNLKKMSYEVEMIPSGASLEFVVYLDGRRLGAQNASVNFIA